MKKILISLLTLLAVGQWSTALAENTDISTLDNVIYIAPFSAEAGTRIAISIRMRNSAAIRGFQFDLYLPKGMTVVKSSKGRIQGSLTESRLPEEDEHDLTFSEQQDGAIRFLCSSQYDETFTGSDGEIATLQVEVSPDMADGEYPIQLKDMKLTETDISKFYEHALIESTVTISTATGIKSNNRETTTNSHYYNLNGQRIERPKKGLYIQNSRKVVVK